jgi:hypothetical protein
MAVIVTLSEFSSPALGMRASFFTGQLDRPLSHRPCRCCREQRRAPAGVHAHSNGQDLVICSWC